jgi:2'-5' RNA ligase
MADNSAKRCFVAIPIDDVVRDDLVDATRRLKHVTGLRLVPAENMHVTVKFLGGVLDPQIDDVLEAMRLGVEGISRFPLNTEAIACIPNERRPRVLAAVLNCPPLLSMLVEQLEDAMQMIGFVREVRAYRPHITVGRFRRAPRGGLPHVDLPPTGFVADRVELMQSILYEDGPRYQVMSSVALP